MITITDVQESVRVGEELEAEICARILRYFRNKGRIYTVIKFDRHIDRLFCRGGKAEFFLEIKVRPFESTKYEETICPVEKQRSAALISDSFGLKTYMLVWYQKDDIYALYDLISPTREALVKRRDRGVERMHSYYKPIKKWRME